MPWLLRSGLPWTWLEPTWQSCMRSVCAPAHLVVHVSSQPAIDGWLERLALAQDVHGSGEESQDAFAMPLMGRGMPWTVLHRDKTATCTLLDLTFMPMTGHFLVALPRLSWLPYGHLHDAYAHRLRTLSIMLKRLAQLWCTPEVTVGTCSWRAI